MDDPASLYLFLFGMLFFISVYILGLFTASDTEKDSHSVLGFSDTTAGQLALSLTFGGLFINLFLSNNPELALWEYIVYSVLSFILVIILFSTGMSKGSEKSRNFPTMLPIVGIDKIIGIVITFPAKMVFNFFNINAATGMTEEDVLSMMDTVEEQDIIDGSQKEMIANIFELDSVDAVDIMTHRTDVEAVDEDESIQEVVNICTEKGFSRLPVYHKTLDNVTGIVYIKDLLPLLNNENFECLHVREYMRSAMFVPESCRASNLLIEFQKKHTQIAIVVDEYGGTSGIVTMEDVLEEIVGNIQDEFDNEEEEIVPCEQGGVICDGSVDLEDLFDALNLPLPELTDDEDFDSVSGLITERIGKIPLEGEIIEIIYGGVLFRVLQVGERRILKVQCAPVYTPEEDEE